MSRNASSLVLLAFLVVQARAQTGPSIGIYTGLDSKAIVTGDFDLDGKPDGIHVTTGALYVEINYGVGNQPLQIAHPGLGGTDLRAIDLDGDGDLDFLVLKSVNNGTSTSDVRVVINNGGLLSGTILTIRGSRLPKVADLDHDGLLDLIDRDRWYRATSGGVFSPTALAVPVAISPHAPAGRPVTNYGTWFPGDFDGDGDDDLLTFVATTPTPLSSFGHVDLYLNDGTGMFSFRHREQVSSPSFQSPNTDITVEDFDGDGIDDFIVEDTNHGALVVHHGDVAGRFARGISVVPGFGHYVGCLDIDGDLDLDLVVRRPAATLPFPPPNPMPPPSLNVIENLGQGVYREPVNSTLSFITGGFDRADFDLDGREDFLFIGPYAGAGYGVAYSTMSPDPFASVHDIQVVSGAGQSTPAGTTFPAPLVVRVLDRSGVVVSGAALNVTAEGQIPVGGVLLTDAAGQASITLGASNEVGEHRIAVSSPGAALRRFLVTVTPTRVIVPIAGFTQGGSLGGNFGENLRYRVEDLAGNPLSGISTDVVRGGLGVGYSVPGAPVVTDALGEVSIAIATGMGSHAASIGDLGDLGISVAAERATTVEARLFTRRAFSYYGPNATGSTWVRSVRYHHENPWVPIVLMADLPQPAPTPSIFGNWYTSFLNPQPSLYLLDGLGLTGPPVPWVITVPRDGQVGYVFELTFAWNLLPVGTQVVFQFLAYDNAYAFPYKVALSEPVTITF